MCLGQLLALKIHNIFKFKESRHQICSPLDFNLPAWEKFAPPYTSLDLVQNLLSDSIWLWMPLLY